MMSRILFMTRMISSGAASDFGRPKSDSPSSRISGISFTSFFSSSCAARQRGQFWQISSNRVISMEVGPVISVVPLSGMRPQTVSMPAGFWLASQKAALMARFLPTVMPRKSRPQWTLPTDFSIVGCCGVCTPKTPSSMRLKHMENRCTRAASKKPGTATPRAEVISTYFPSSFGWGRPKPRMPSKGPGRFREWSTRRSKPFFI
mmetsp:Transcript_50928/g.121834  ORF Transcript_50928/g.121834 Transcript_50928/m.121834 type:complete len:204 (+) Transcript_50928:676-1287(+)